MEVLVKQMMVSEGVTEELIDISVKKESAPQGRSLSYGLWIHPFIYLR